VVGNATGGVHRPLVVLRRERRDHLPVDRAHIPRSDLRMADSGGMEGVKRGAAQYRWPSLGSEEWQHEGPPSARCPDAPRLSRAPSTRPARDRRGRGGGCGSRRSSVTASAASAAGGKRRRSITSWRVRSAGPTRWRTCAPSARPATRRVTGASQRLRASGLGADPFASSGRGARVCNRSPPDPLRSALRFTHPVPF
jgi:hypothetical protein